MTFLTKHFSLQALTVALIYKHHWKIKLFFRWLKQHLQSRGLIGTDRNRVCVQAWTALFAYLLAGIDKHEDAQPGLLHQERQAISIAELEKVYLSDLFANWSTTNCEIESCIQLDISVF